MITNNFETEHGMTVAEFKKIVAQWPETDVHGEPTEVWMDTGDMLSSPVKSVWRLNWRMLNYPSEEGATGDMCIGPGDNHPWIK